MNVMYFLTIKWFGLVSKDFVREWLRPLSSHVTGRCVVWRCSVFQMVTQLLKSAYHTSVKLFGKFVWQNNEPPWIYIIYYSWHSVVMPVSLAFPLSSTGAHVELSQANATHSGLCHSLKTHEIRKFLILEGAADKSAHPPLWRKVLGFLTLVSEQIFSGKRWETAIFEGPSSERP